MIKNTKKTGEKKDKEKEEKQKSEEKSKKKTQKTNLIHEERNGASNDNTHTHSNSNKEKGEILLQPRVSRKENNKGMLKSTPMQDN